MPKEPTVTTIFDHTFKHAKKLARNFYFKQWAKYPPRCPAFNGEVVYIGREGWEHILDEKHRTRMDLLGRWFSLEAAKYLLETSTAFQDNIKKQDKEYWVFEAIVTEVKIRIIVRSIKGGKKHFYSVIRKGSIEKELRSQ